MIVEYLKRVKKHEKIEKRSMVGIEHAAHHDEL